MKLGVLSKPLSPGDVGVVMASFPAGGGLPATVLGPADVLKSWSGWGEGPRVQKKYG